MRSGGWSPVRDGRRRARTGLAGAIGWLVAATLLAGCATSDAMPTQPTTGMSATPVAPGLRYVALGDSYTIGTSVAEAERFPNQLVAALGPSEPTLALVANLATNGFTTRDVIDVQLPALDTYDPEFVTLCIGVNDVVQRVPLETYEANAVVILDALLERLPPERIVVVAIPDYTVTPQGANYGDPVVARAGIQAENVAMEALTAARAIRYVDIYDISLAAATDPSLVAEDGLHPSGAQYARWVERMLPVVEAAVGR